MSQLGVCSALGHSVNNVFLPPWHVPDLPRAEGNSSDKTWLEEEAAFLLNYSPDWLREAQMSLELLRGEDRVQELLAEKGGRRRILKRMNTWMMMVMMM